MVKEIVKITEERAEEIDASVDKKEVKEIVEDLKDTLNNSNLTALSAPQIGYNKRVVCIRFDDEIKTFINPMLMKSQDLHFQRTFSLYTDKEYIVPLFDTIIVAYQKPNGHVESNKFEGLASHVMQLYMNLLDSVLVEDYGLEVLEGFDKLKEEEKDKIISMYLEQLKEYNKNYMEEIEKDEMLKQTYDAIRYTTSVVTGETKLKQPSLNRKQRRQLDKLTKNKK